MLGAVERVTCFAGLALQQRPHTARLATDGNRRDVTQFMLVEDFENGLGTKTLVQKHPANADFEHFQAFYEPAHNVGHLLAIFDEVQRHPIAPIISHDRNRGIPMKMGRPRFWHPTHNLILVFIRLPMIRAQRQVNRNVEVSLAFPDTRMWRHGAIGETSCSASAACRSDLAKPPPGPRANDCQRARLVTPDKLMQYLDDGP